ncbi:uncharacterized protein TRIADDRAFT_61155 [Trichoplax adhaerens]|uniref:Uncharacterized protein n=1 Tax=Trichoplax adhaerens TaxID=10228 RepID=B3SA70_TRIAD|nr:predicted protein [Trichoplax adhaerens]EDV20386.1 predicted protein [Trichoplax adhaerens]|eukprot:XP_002117080.1 predicted protein [Trichoplax adhaerens]
MSAPVTIAQQPGQYLQTSVMHPYVLPIQHKQTSFGISVTMIVLGFASIVTGGIGFGFYGYWRSLSVITGLDIWVGLGYLLAGIFGTVVHTNQRNPHLMHCYYAFSIISLIFSILQFGISIPAIIYSYYGIIWHAILSLVMSIVGFALIVTIVIILSRNIYCQPGLTNPGVVQYHGHQQAATIVQYQGGQQRMVAMQPNQPVMVMQPTQPIYVSQAPGGQYPAVPPQTVINSPQTTQVVQPAQPIQYQQIQELPKKQPAQPSEYLLAGIFGTIVHTNQRNPHLMHCYYAFSIISLIFSILQFGISIPAIIYSYYGIIWHAILSLVMSIVGFALIVTIVIILSRNIYCQPGLTNPGVVQYHGHQQAATIVQYQGGQQRMVAMQPNQPVMVMQPTQPIYVSQAPGGQYPAVPPQTVINSPQTTQVVQPAQPIQYQQIQELPKKQPAQPSEVSM